MKNGVRIIIDVRIGTIIKKIRTGKNLTLKQLSDSSLSVSFISKFESGQCSISVERLHKLLKKLHVSYGEFLFVAGMSPEFSGFFFKELRKAKNTNKFKNIIEESQENKLHLSIINIVRERYTEQDINEVVTYLFAQDTWYYYEFLVFNNTFRAFPIDIVKINFKRILKLLSYYENSLSVNHLEAAKVMINMAVYFCEHHDKNNSKAVLEMLEKILNGSDWIYEINKYNYISGIWEICFNDAAEGIRICEKSINVLDILSNKHIKLEHQSYLNRICELNNIEIS